MIKLILISTLSSTGFTDRIMEEIGRFAMAEGLDRFFAYGRNLTHIEVKKKFGNLLDFFGHLLKYRLMDYYGL